MENQKQELLHLVGKKTFVCGVYIPSETNLMKENEKFNIVIERQPPNDLIYICVHFTSTG